MKINHRNVRCEKHEYLQGFIIPANFQKTMSENENESMEVSSLNNPEPECSCVALYRLLLTKFESMEARMDNYEQDVTRIPMTYNFARREKEVRASVIRQSGLPEVTQFSRIIDDWIEENVKARMALIHKAVDEEKRQDLRSLPRNCITIQPSYRVRLAIAEIIADCGASAQSH